VVSVDKTGEGCEVILVENGFKVNQMPLYYQNKEISSYSRALRNEKHFNNPQCVNLLIEKLGLQVKNNFSLMTSLFDFEIDEGERASDLLKNQNRQMALQSVQKGIACVKEDRSQEAMMCYNKALTIDSENVEAYVARGALLANDGDFNKAIQDLEKALLINNTHVNAKIYLKQVCLANAVKLEKVHRYEDALIFIHKALDVGGECDIVRLKVVEVEKKIEEVKKNREKDLYGPTLPDSKPIEKKKRKKHKKDRSSRRDDK